MIGELIGGRYEIEELVGTGGMSSVYRARDSVLERRVALKVLHEHFSADPEYVERFRREARAIARLNHPNIVTVIDRGEFEGRQFIVFEHIPGENLKEVVEREGQLPVAQALALTHQIARGLAFAHEHGVVHRDVKPANIVVGRHGDTVLLDWGLAKVRGSATGDALLSSDADVPRLGATRHGAVIGTPAYMSPEQAAGDVSAIDERTDVFALGALLYHVLAGRPPNDGPTSESQLERARSASYPSIAALQPAAPAPLVAICSRAMARDPAARFASASELADALEAALTDALAGKEMQVVNVFARLLSGAMLLAAVAAAVLVWQAIPSLHELGLGVFPIMALASLGAVVGLLELATRGRHQLESLLLALAGMTFAGGILSTAMDLLNALGSALANREAVDGWLIAAGGYEAIGNLVTGTALSGALLLVWGVARRQALQAKRPRR
jgi:tRNA A-37 threonylcarbamoyl transferase component Bud32